MFGVLALLLTDAGEAVVDFFLAIGFEIIDQSALDQQLINETAIRIARVRASNEGQEGIRSFLEKRKPSWVGEDEA